MDLQALTHPLTPRRARLLGLGVGVLLVHAGLVEWLLADDSRSASPGRAGPQRAVQVVASRPAQAINSRPKDTITAAAARQPTPQPARSQPAASRQPALPSPIMREAGPPVSLTSVAPEVVETLADEDMPSTASVGVEAGDLNAAPPVYATRVPAPTTLRYAVQRLAAGGIVVRPEAAAEALLQWRHDGSRYFASLRISGTRRPLLEQSSRGSFDANGLAPERFIDRRRGRLVGAAHFRRDSGRISFSGPTHDFPAWPGAQDRLTWLPQLAAVVAMAAAGPASGQAMPAEISVFVADARGLARLWVFQALGFETVPGPNGPAQALHLQRSPQRPDDMRVDVWLDPSLDFWPLRLTQAAPFGGATLDLQLREVLPAEALAVDAALSLSPRP